VTCGAKRSKHDMVRFVLDCEGEPVRDRAFRMEGRGAYTCHSEACMQGIKNVKKAQRAFKRFPVGGARRASPE
jgi:predicted RNA-binding protein YlxR (DUF448 family)